MQSSCGVVQRRKRRARIEDESRAASSASMSLAVVKRTVCPRLSARCATFFRIMILPMLLGPTRTALCPDLMGFRLKSSSDRLTVDLLRPGPVEVDHGFCRAHHRANAQFVSATAHDWYASLAFPCPAGSAPHAITFATRLTERILPELSRASMVRQIEL